MQNTAKLISGAFALQFQFHNKIINHLKENFGNRMAKGIELDEDSILKKKSSIILHMLKTYQE